MFRIHQWAAGLHDTGPLESGAVLLEIAAEFNRQTTRPKRSILFTFFTAEEGAMLGSKYFVNHPTIDPRSLVANLNVEWRPESFYRRYQRR